MNQNQQRIIDEARKRGYKIMEAPIHCGQPGVRIGGNKVPDGPDHWMVQANDVLFAIQVSAIQTDQDCDMSELQLDI